jgi:uncharacterized membrane protein YsdA (DUF1294 family)
MGDFIRSGWGILAIYLLAVNIIAFIVMGVDKGLSTREGARRVPERVLFLLAVIGGSLGSILGMQVFRHKTKHWYFVVGMPLILILQVAAAIAVAYLKSK